MGRRLDHYNFVDLTGRGGRHFVAKYPWDAWTDGEAWAAYPNDDYTCKTQSFVQGLYKVARERKLRVFINILDTEGQVLTQEDAYSGDTEVGAVVFKFALGRKRRRRRKR